MLRRRLLMTLLALTALLLLLAVVALWALQDVLAGLNHLNTDARSLVERCNELNLSISATELELHALRTGRERHLDPLIHGMQHTRDLAGQLRQHYATRGQPMAGALDEMSAHLALLEGKLGALVTTEDPALTDRYNLEALEGVAKVREDILLVTRYAQDHGRQEQASLTHRFRWLVVGMALGFMAVINLSVLLLMRMTHMILRPVERLVEASRELAQEHFSHRVNLPQQGEFDELGQAFNRLAEQLEQNEQRKIDTLRQVALTLNHELNNAIAIIELQLTLLSRQQGNREAFQRCLKQIQENLQRMAKVVEALKRVRRIVLTDYVEGVKMLDLERSMQVGGESSAGEAPEADAPFPPVVEPPV